jgi:succinate dehydrogenase / fumarate reductase flavoprotein subunit
MIQNVTVKRNNKDLATTLEKLKQIRERYKNITLDDHSRFANQTYVFAHQFQSMLELALVITKGALQRNEFRGAHFKPEFPERNDAEWLKTTIAQYTPDEPKISYEKIDMRHLQPIMRDYTQAKKVKPKLDNVPTNIALPI